MGMDEGRGTHYVQVEGGGCVSPSEAAAEAVKSDSQRRWEGDDKAVWTDGLEGREERLNFYSGREKWTGKDDHHRLEKLKCIDRSAEGDNHTYYLFSLAKIIPVLYLDYVDLQCQTTGKPGFTLS